MFRTTALIFVVGGTLSLAGLQAQLPDTTVAAVDRLVERALAQSNTPAASVAIVMDGKPSLVKAYGDARLDPETPATPEMRFAIGSVSKQFLAAAFLLAAEKGILSLDDPVGKYLPTLTRANEISIRQLLSHTAGYQDYWPQDYVIPLMFQPITPDSILELWATKPLDFDPGTAWQYSNTGYVAAGRVLEKATGAPMMEILRTNIFTQLGMESVIDLNDGPLSSADAAGYMQYALGPLRLAPPERPGWMFAAGELAMTARDLALWDIGLINGSVLTPRSFDEMITPLRLKNGAPTTYGLGVFVQNANGHPKISHGGGTASFTTANTIWPDSKLAVVVLSNKSNSPAPDQITSGIQALLLGLPQDPDAAKWLEQARSILADLQEGRLTAELFTDNGRSYFTPEALADYASTLKPLGSPRSFQLVSTGQRGGFTTRIYQVGFATRTQTLVVLTGGDQRIEEYLIL